MAEGVTFAEQKGPSKDTENPQDEDKKYRASSAVTLKTRSAWDEAKLNPWYSPRFWLDLLIHPSVEYKMNHVRRRARLFALVALCFLFTSIISNSISYVDGRDSTILGMMLLSNLLMLIAYTLSRTKHATSGKSLGVFAVWLLPYLSTILNLYRDTNSSGDATVTDSISWLYSPAWYLMAAIFLSRSMTKFVLLMDAASLMFLPVIAGTTFFHIRKLLFFHMVNGSLLLLASVIAFRDKLQLYSQHDGQVHEDQHRAGTVARFFLQPHKDITDRIFRRRARILSGFLLFMIPFAVIWTAMEASGWVEGMYDPVIVAVATAVVVASSILYFLSRTQYTRWATRWTLFMLLLLPYLYSQGSKTTLDGQMYANLITITATSILGVTLLSGPELVALSGIIFFFNLYSPIFPPHIIASLILLAASLVYRRDIKEIHDTAFHRDDLYEDDSGDLLIPWEKRYFFNCFSYIQMVIALYIFVFATMGVLGLTALIAAATTTITSVPVTTVALTLLGQSPTHILYVHTKDCSALTPQTYTVSGSNSKFTYISPVALKSNATNTIQLTVSNSIGAITEISFALGDGNYYITQHDQCNVDAIEVWDNVQEKAYSTDIYDDTPTATSRRLLQAQQPFSDEITAEDYYSGFGAVQLREKYRVASCTVLSVPVCRGSFNWIVITCTVSESAQIASAVACYQAGDCASDQGCCSGHGTCVVANQGRNNVLAQIIPSCTGAQCVFCVCDLFYGGSMCSTPAAASCGNQNTTNANLTDPDLSRYAYIGVCNQLPPLDFEDGAYGSIMKRVVKADYQDGVALPIDYPKTTKKGNQNTYTFPSNVPFADVLASNMTSSAPAALSQTGLNMFGVGVYETAMADLVDYELDYFDQYPYTSAANGTVKNPPLFTRAAQDLYTGVTFTNKQTTSVPVPRQYPNAATGWIDLSYIYTLVRTPLVLRQNDKAFLSESAVLQNINAERPRSQEFILATQLYIRYHNLLAKSFERYYCGSSPIFPPSNVKQNQWYPPQQNPILKNCTLYTQFGVTDVLEMIFELSRTGTIYFSQNLLVSSLLASFFTSPNYQNFDPSVSLLFGDLMYPTDQNFVAQQYLAENVELLFSIRGDTTKINSIYPPFYNQPTCMDNPPVPVSNFTYQLLNLMNTPARAFGSPILPTWKTELTNNIERARDLGLGKYVDYYNALIANNPTTVQGSVFAVNQPDAAHQELIPGVQQETNYYQSQLGGNYWTAPYPPVALALTIAKIWSTVRKDRLGIFNAGSGIPTVLQKYFDPNSPSACYINTTTGGCSSDSVFAWAVLAGPNGQPYYDPSYPGGVAALLAGPFTDPGSSQLQTLFAIEATLFYNFTVDTIPLVYGSLSNYLDTGYSSCVPSTITSTIGNGYQSPSCGCCKQNGACY